MFIFSLKPVIAAANFFFFFNKLPQCIRKEASSVSDFNQATSSF